MTRRKFLKVAGLALSGWLLSPFLSETAVVSSWLAGEGQELVGQIKSGNRTLHPEWSFTNRVRETVIAHKVAWLMHRSYNNGHISTIMGAGHMGMEQEFTKTP
jgi:hypothetical protein